MLAIRDDVDAGLGLAAHGFGDRAFDPRREERLVDRFPLCFLLDQVAQIVGPRQAADMRRQDAIHAPLHVILPSLFWLSPARHNVAHPPNPRPGESRDPLVRLSELG